MEISQENFETIQEMQAQGFVGNLNLKDTNVKLKDVNNVIIHDLASINHKMTKAEYEKLVNNIAEIGQTMPALFWRGKLVDGRHRLKALKQIGISQIKFLELRNNLTKSDVEDIVRSTENRKNRTKSQLAIDANEYMKKNNLTIRQVAPKFGVSTMSVSSVNKISEKLGSDILKELSENGVCKLPNGRYADSLNKILGYIKSLEDSPEPRAVIRSDLKEHVSMLKALKNNKDLEGLSILKEQLTKFIDDVNRDI